MLVFYVTTKQIKMNKVYIINYIKTPPKKKKKKV